MIKADKFWDFLFNKDFTFFSGVPCSILEPILNELAKQKNIDYLPAVNENSAIGIASGARIAGRKSGILIQNSGLGNIINPLTSFNLIYKVPVLMFITWRGFENKDAPEHTIMGREMLRLLNCLKIQHIILTDNFQIDLSHAIEIMEKEQIPVAVILKKGLIS
jgi:sulfopyruvate decarboxylase alpha subunit